MRTTYSSLDIDSIIPHFDFSKFQDSNSAEAEQAGLSHTWSQTPEVRFSCDMVHTGMLCQHITYLLSILNSGCAGVYQNSTFGQAAILPMKYTNAIVLGTVSDTFVLKCSFGA